MPEAILLNHGNLNKLRHSTHAMIEFYLNFSTEKKKFFLKPCIPGFNLSSTECGKKTKLKLKNKNRIKHY